MNKEENLKMYQDLHDVKNWGLDGWREILNAPIGKIPKLISELITKKGLRTATADAKHQSMIEKSAARLIELTGMKPGEKSGVVRADEIAEKKIADDLRKIKIAAALIMAYSDDGEKRFDSVFNLVEKHPEMLNEVIELSNKARKRDYFKNAQFTVGKKSGVVRADEIAAEKIAAIKDASRLK